MLDLEHKSGCDWAEYEMCNCGLKEAQDKELHATRQVENEARLNQTRLEGRQLAAAYRRESMRLYAAPIFAYLLVTYITFQLSETVGWWFLGVTLGLYALAYVSVALLEYLFKGF